MNWVSTRLQDGRRPDGVFSTLTDELGNKTAFTIEHAYEQFDGSWQPKIPSGTYTCVRGTHALKDGIPFITFEITGVPGHTGLLLHKGNFDSSSEGCVCPGDSLARSDQGQMVTNSEATWKKLMALQDGLDTFEWTFQG